jgi:polysaccharide chain length determinant protein (PEP-CTERM system associated)
MNEIHALVGRCATIGWRRRWLVVGLAWLICLIGWTVVAAIPNRYEANARMYVDSDAVLTPLLKGLALDNTPLNQVEVLQRTLLSRPNIEKLISKTGLDLSVTGPADQENLVKALGNDIKVTPQTRSLFTISYRSTSPQLAYSVVQTILSIFVESKIGTSRTDMENARRFLQQQIAQYEQGLQEAEARRAEFRSKYIDLLPSDASGGVSRLETARVLVTTLEGQLIDLNGKRDLIKREMTTTPPILTFDEADRGGGSRGSVSSPDIKRAEATLAELRLRYTEQHPDVIAARQRIEQLRTSDLGAVSAPAAEPRSRGPGISNPVYEHLKVQLFDTEATIASLQRQVVDATKERDHLDLIARSVPGVQADFANLNRDYDVLHKSYTELLARRESMRLAAAADAGTDKIKLQVIDPPQVPQNPVAPQRALLISAVLGLGLIGGIGGAVLLQQFDRSFHSVEELNSFGLPVAGGISLIAQPIPLRRQTLAVASFAMALLLLGAAYGGLMLNLLHTA